MTKLDSKCFGFFFHLLGRETREKGSHGEQEISPKNHDQLKRANFSGFSRFFFVFKEELVKTNHILWSSY